MLESRSIAKMNPMNSSHLLRFQSLRALSCLDAFDPRLHVFVSRVQRNAELVEHGDTWRKADVREGQGVTYHELLARQMFFQASKCLLDLLTHLLQALRVERGPALVMDKNGLSWFQGGVIAVVFPQPHFGAAGRIPWHQGRVRKTVFQVFVDYSGFVDDRPVVEEDRYLTVR